MEYLTVREAALKWNISERSVQNYCSNNKIPGAKCIGKQWMIPSSVERPADGRTKNSKQQVEISTYHFPLYVHSGHYANKEALSDEERMLYDAEILFLTGEYYECILNCRQLQREAVSPSVIFGSHCTIGYAAMLLGLYTEYQRAVRSMKRIIRKETTHKADYELLLVGLVAHVTRNYSMVSKMETDKLSFDALYYYRYLLMLSAFVSLTIENSNTIHSFLTLLRELEIKGITPTALCVNCMLSAFYKRIGDLANQRLYIQKACDLAAQTHFTSLFIKYYFIQSKLMDQFLSEYDNDYKNMLKRIEGDTMLKWLVIHKLSSGFVPLPEFTVMQNEILVLMPGSVPLETIAKIKNIPIETVEKEISEILRISGVKSLNQLTKYARERFKEMDEHVQISDKT